MCLSATLHSEQGVDVQYHAVSREEGVEGRAEIGLADAVIEIGDIERLVWWDHGRRSGGCSSHCFWRTIVWWGGVVVGIHCMLGALGSGYPAIRSSWSNVCKNEIITIITTSRRRLPQWISLHLNPPPSLYVLKLCAIHKLLLWEVSRPSLGCIASFSSTTPLCRLRYTAVFATFPKPPSPAAGAAPVITEGMGGDMAIDRGSETGLLKGRQTSSGPYDRAFQTMAAALRRWAFLRASLLKRLRSRSVSRSKMFWLITWFFAPFASFDYFALPLPPF